MSSAIYEGWVRHRRTSPRKHDFCYRVFMPYLRLDELPDLFDDVPLWSARGWAPARFKREDFLGDPAVPLEQAVKDLVQEQQGVSPAGPVYMLANLRYFGYIMNPITCYYCYAEDGETLEYLVAEVTNTPWNERHAYVLPADDDGSWLRATFDKAMHVSPFNPMDMQYQWHSNTPGRKLVLNLANTHGGEKVFDATLSLNRKPLTSGALVSQLSRYPMMTAKVAGAIYWQALKIWLKGIQFHPHPNSEIKT